MGILALVLGLFVFLFFGENVELFVCSDLGILVLFWVFCMFVSQEKFLVYRFVGD